VRGIGGNGEGTEGICKPPIMTCDAQRPLGLDPFPRNFLRENIVEIE
jgi:hypothetical protein